MASKGFNLHKWTLNSKELCNLIQKSELEGQTTGSTVDQDLIQDVTEDDQSYTKSTLGSVPTNTEDSVKVLGISWDTHSDTLFYDFDEFKNCVSKLQLATRVFYPFGFITPFTFKVNMLFQELCTEKSNWDNKPSLLTSYQYFAALVDKERDRATWVQ